MPTHPRDLYTDYKGRVYLRMGEGSVRVGRVFRQGSRWKFQDIDNDGDGRRYPKKTKAVGALARWMDRR